MARIAVLGASGRMGAALIRLIVAGGAHQLVGALTEPDDPARGQDAGQVAGGEALGVRLSDDLATALGGTDGCDVVIDFTAPTVTERHASACAAEGYALVVGTTGLGAAEIAALEEAAKRIPVLWARNMSLGVTVLTELVRQATVLLGADYDVEVVEAHHRHKKDAPSGTALQLGEAAAAARELNLNDVAVYGHAVEAGTERRAGTIGFSSVRGGTIVGDHTVLLAGEEEVIELVHRATDRALFARGALRAAGWLVNKPPGQYSLRDVLGLSGVGGPI